MITINIRTSAVLGEILGDWKFQTLVPEKSTFEYLMKELIRVHGKRLKQYLFDQNGKRLSPHLMFMVNGRNIRFLGKEKTILQDEDQVTILLPAGGG